MNKVIMHIKAGYFSIMLCLQFAYLNSLLIYLTFKHISFIRVRLKFVSCVYSTTEIFR